MLRHRLRRARSGQLVVLVALLVLVPTTAFADNSVIDSDPRPRTQSDTQPGRVTIAFEEDLPTRGATIVVQDSDGDDVTNGAYQIDANNIYTDLVYPLQRGTYTVHYRVQEKNNEPFGGEFQFSYGPGDFPPLAQDSAPMQTWRGTDRIPQIVALSSDPPDSGTPTGGGAETGGDADGAEPESRMDRSGSAADSEKQQPAGSSEATDASAADGGAFLWIWYALAAAIVAAGAATVVFLRRR